MDTPWGKISEDTLKQWSVKKFNTLDEWIDWEKKDMARINRQIAAEQAEAIRYRVSLW